ncbi:efflux RND transporter permease subunit [Draconibacterium mangrovi]|uniref:efflux RND transporter permease subunit n=1 Tax=Draconibacterium mangrovi TaxID=2697469 RepID=UPI0013D3DBD1|nr:efflux RND transporter permease subunit [Draconibacterium mangrovi]
MVKFLIHRPIAVTMAFLAFLLIGLATTVQIPVSLMPDIDIPVISIRIPLNEMPARQLENTVVKQIRSVLKEVNHIEEMKSETRDGTAWIELRFKHGTSIDLASIEVNEKVDKAMNYLPRNMSRPEVIRASASDIPVFYLMVNKKQELITGNKEEFLQLSNFTSQVIRKRLEQLPEVALVDMSGLQYPEIKITPHAAYLQNGTFTISQLEQELNNNNIDLGNLLVRDGQYQYNIRFNTRLRDVSEIAEIPVNLNGKVVSLSEIAHVGLQPQKPQGNIKINSESAISLAVIKQSDAKMADLKDELNELVGYFKEDYPELEFTITRDQSKLLEYSINNLGQSLLIGGMLAFLILFVFLRERKAPWLIGISIPVSLLLALFFFYLFKLSINIISLSGLILGVGMMIDNSIIVIDNITQYRDRHFTLSRACEVGTNEVIRPLISSVLTTCAVFIPLIFMKGMAGALFFDQAIAVTIGLSISLLVSITLLPTLYRLFYSKTKQEKQKRQKDPGYYRLYERGLKFVLRNQAATIGLVILLLAGAAVLGRMLTTSRFPEVSQDEIVLKIDWNEPLTLEENNKRVNELMVSLSTEPVYIIEEAGKQQYLLNSGEDAGTTENKLIIKAESPARLSKMIKVLSTYFSGHFPDADFSFTEADNLFNLAFGKSEAPLIARFSHFNPGNKNYLDELSALLADLDKNYHNSLQSKLITRQLILLETDPEKLMFYEVDNDELYREVKSAFNVNTVFTINNNNMFVPVSIGNSYQSVYQIIQNIQVRNQNNEEIPLSGLVKVNSGSGLKSIVAGKDNEYFPVEFEIDPGDFKTVSADIKTIAANHTSFDLSFGGSILSNRAMLTELLLIIGVSLLLLYFILAAQFESFVLPVIVLLEVPIDLYGAFLALKLFGAGINIMSAIGIIVMAGIIINDSILKIDTMNKLHDSGYSLIRSVMEAGHRRLKPIIMTSLTTILAMLPFLFQKGMGAELQQPLALAIIGGMLLGTLVSLFFIPMMYNLLKKGR